MKIDDLIQFKKMNFFHFKKEILKILRLRS